MPEVTGWSNATGLLWKYANTQWERISGTNKFLRLAVPLEDIKVYHQKRSSELPMVDIAMPKRSGKIGVLNWQLWS